MSEHDSIGELASSRVQPLVGARLVSTDRAGDMQRFTFSLGANLGEYVLHVLCAWHLVHRGSLATGSGDLKQPVQPVDPALPFDWEGFDWKPPGSNRRDHALNRVLGEHPDGLLVESAGVDPVGGLRMQLEGMTTLRLFPAQTMSYYDVAEHWRLIHVDSADPHLVVTAEGAYEV